MNLTEIYAVQAEERRRNSPEFFFEQYADYFGFVREIFQLASEFSLEGVAIGTRHGLVRLDSLNHEDEESEGVLAGVMGRGLALRDLVVDEAWSIPDHMYSGAFGPSHSLAYATISEVERIRQLLEYEEASTEHYGEVKDLFKRSWRRRNQDDAIDFFNAEDSRRRVRNIPLLHVHHTSGQATHRTGYPKEKERMMFL